MWPFLPKWKSKDPNKRVSGIGKLNSLTYSHQRILIDIAKNDSYLSAREAAVKKITDQNILGDIAKNDKDRIVREAAVKRLTDQTVLIHLAGNDKERGIRLTALKRITDQDVLFDFYKNSSDGDVRKLAIRTLAASLVEFSDKNISIRLHQNTGDGSYLRELSSKKNAGLKLNNQGIIAEIAKHHEHWIIRNAAVSKITDQNILAEISRNEENDKVRYTAVEKLNDQNVISDVAKNDKDGIICEIAIRKLTDQNLLADIAKNHSKIKGQITASLKLTDLSQKTENLIRLFHCSYAICEKSFYDFQEKNYKPEIANSLKDLFISDKLSKNDKIKILELKGQLVKQHIDSGYSFDNCSWHSDERAEYFNL
jgi:hypothetical protein